MLNIKPEPMLCVTEQLWTRGPRHHLLSSVAPAFCHSSLLHQLFVRLLPAPAAAAHDLLLREDPADSASGVEAGEVTAPVTFNLSLMCDLLSLPRVRGSTDQQDGWLLSWVERRPCPSHGGLHGDRLPAVLAAIRSRGDACILWTARSCTTCHHFDPLPASKDEHCPQPCYLCALQPPGNFQSLSSK